MSRNETFIIDSTYRNRTKYPNPFQFDIKSKDNTSFDKLTAGDPVSTQSPIVSWSPDDIAISGTIVSIIQRTVVIIKSADDIKKPPNYFKGIALQYESVTTPGTYIRNMIIGSTYRNTNVAGDYVIEIHLKDENITFDDRIEIGMAVTFITPGSITDKHLFIPGNNLLQSYNETYIITNNTLGPSSNKVNVTKYNDDNNIAYFEGSVTGWLTSHEYSLRIDTPYMNASVGSTILGINYTVAKNELNTDSKEISYESVGDYIRFISCDPSSVDNEQTNLRIDNLYLFIETKSGSVLPGDYLTSIDGQNIKIISELGGSSYTVTTIDPPPGGNSQVGVDIIAVGYQFSTNQGALTAPIYTVTSVNAPALEITFDPPLPAGAINMRMYTDVGGNTGFDLNFTSTEETLSGTLYRAELYDGTFSLSTYTLINSSTQQQVSVQVHSILLKSSSELPSLPITGDAFELIKINEDNEGFIKNGVKSSISKYEEKKTKEKIRLVELSIPNINSSFTNNIFSYNYLYLRIYNVSKGYGKTILHNSTIEEDVVFHIPIRKQYCCISDRFIIFDKLPDISIQSNIELSQDLHFELCLPNGKIYEIDDTDNFPPSYPKYQNQVYAKFLIEK
jgi:hypothetical protein